MDYRADFFGKPAFLTVSGQLNAEYYACGLSNVYTFGPTFRAENSHTARHLAEFLMIEPEMAFCTLEDDMQCAEDYVRFCCRHALDTCRCAGRAACASWLKGPPVSCVCAARRCHSCRDLSAGAIVSLRPRTRRRLDLEFLGKQVDSGTVARLEAVAETPFKRLSYTEAIEILEEVVRSKKKKFEFPVRLFCAPSGHPCAWLAGPDQLCGRAVDAYTAPAGVLCRTCRQGGSTASLRSCATRGGRPAGAQVAWGVDLASEHERYLTEEVFRQPVIVFNYPRSIKAFYMRQNDDGRTVAAMDVLVPKVGELIGGSQREERLEVRTVHAPTL